MLPTVIITPAAEKFMNRIVRFAGLPAGAGFRLVVSPGGCSGYNSEFSAEPAPQDGEQTLVYNGLNIFLPAESRLMLDGVTIDFVDTPTKTGLSFFNPKQEACGCSSSGSSTEAAPLPGVSTIAISSIGRGGRPVVVS